jgi:antirestriction protein ArdC
MRGTARGCLSERAAPASPEVENLIRASGADLRLGGDRAFYHAGHDFVQVPRPEAYFEPINWHRTVLHELGHWVGAPHRLARDLSGGFGSKKYAQEELVAEMTAAFCCASLGIAPTVRHADYIGCRLKLCRARHNLINHEQVIM